MIRPVFSAALIVLLSATAALPAEESRPDPVPVIIDTSPEVPLLNSIVVEGKGIDSKTPLTGYELADTEKAAQQLGVDVDSFVAEQTFYADFFELVARYSADTNSNVLAAGIASEPESHAFITFTRKPSDEVLHELALLPSDTLVRYGMELDLSTLLDFQARIMTELSEEFPEGGYKAYSRIDEVTGVVELAVDSPLIADELQLNRIIETARAAISKHLDSAQRMELGAVTVKSIFTDTLGEIEYRANVQGGRPLYHSGNLECTTGFTAKIPNGSSGVVTAGHCELHMLYNNQPGVIQLSRTAPDHVDVKFYRTLAANGHTTHPSFYAGPSSGVRIVTSTAAPTIGQAVCTYGANSGYGCTTVYQVNICISDGTTQACRQAATETDITDWGDSGGPWFLANQARGITTAGMLYDGKWRTFFSSITVVPDFLDVNVLTN